MAAFDKLLFAVFIALYWAKASLAIELYTPCERKEIILNALSIQKEKNIYNDFPTLGIEIEGVIQHPKKRFFLKKKNQEIEIPPYQKMANVIEETLRKKLPKETEIKNEYESGFMGAFEHSRVSYTKDNIDYEWNIKQDFSIAKHSGEPAEFVSPIIRNQEDLELHLEVLSELRKNGFTEEPQSAGVHVHVGATKNNKTLEGVLLKSILEPIEKELVHTLKQSKNRKKYSGLTLQEEKTWALQFLKDTQKSRLFYELTDNRYKNLNLASLNLHGTVEFRLFNSTVNPEIIREYARFSQALMKAVQNADPRLVNYIMSGQESLENLAKALELKLPSNLILIQQIDAELRRAKLKRALTIGKDVIEITWPSVITAVFAYQIISKSLEEILPSNPKK